MGKLRREVGVWGSLTRPSLRDYFSLEYIASVVIGVVGTLLLVHFVATDKRVGMAGDFLSISAALVGVVVAAMALVVSLMSDEFIRFLEGADSEEKPYKFSFGTSKILNFLAPFMVVIAIQIATVLSTVFYRAFASIVPSIWEHWIFGLVLVFFVLSCLEVITLARSIFMFALLRSGFVMRTSD